MLDFEGDRLHKECSGVILLRKQAVFASMPGTLTNDLYQLIHAWATTLGITLKSSGLWTAKWPEYHRR